MDTAGFYRQGSSVTRSLSESSFFTPPNDQSPRYPLPAHRQHQPPLYQPETESSFVYSDGKKETGESMHGEFTYVTSSKSVNE